MNNVDIFKEYENCEYEVKVYKTKGMKYSRHIFKADCKEHIMIGICSMLQSLVDSKVATEQELKDMVDLVIETRKSGVRNRVIYNNLEEE